MGRVYCLLITLLGEFLIKLFLYYIELVGITMLVNGLKLWMKSNRLKDFALAKILLPLLPIFDFCVFSLLVEHSVLFSPFQVSLHIFPGKFFYLGHFHTICAHESKLAVAYATGAVLVITDDDYEHQVAIGMWVFYIIF